MKLLLDTHVFLWALESPERLPPAARTAIEDSANDVFVSAVVTWEIAIKYALGKLRLPSAPATFVPSRLRRLGFRELPITVAHTLAVEALPRYHADPFDRILVAQASVEALTLVSVDPEIRRYPVTIIGDDD